MEFEDGYRLTEEEILDAGPIIEAGPAVVVPRRGGRQRSIFEWDGQTQEGTVKLAVIRPCVSRGKRIRGLPPIYTQEMLAENAEVYSGWLMYADHFSGKIREALNEILQEAPGRSIRDLGGRILRSWWEPDYVAEWDDGRDYQKGAVLAEALPQPVARAMLEADPEILNVSHNAWPTGAVVGKKYGKKGAIIEGIRRDPEGSVDWVPRGGAGGQIAESDVELAVSVLRATYASPTVQLDLSKIKDGAALAEALEEHAPDLLSALGGKDAVAKGFKADDPAPANGGLSEEKVREIITGALREAKTPTEESVEEMAERLIEEREASRELATYAHELIEGAGLPPEWEADLKRRYAVLPSGPSQAITLAESLAEKADEDEKDEKHFVRESLDRDLKHAAKLIEASGGTVRVKGLGASSSDPEGDDPNKAKDEKVAETTRAWLDPIGGLGPVQEGQKESDLVTSLLSEGVTP